MTQVVIPGSHSPPFGQDGLWRTEWYRFLRNLASQPGTSSALVAQLAALADRVSAIENESDFLAELIGAGSVRVTGSLAAGSVTFSLVNDESAPGSSYYYGTNISGEKGWHQTPFGSIGATFDGGGAVVEVGAFCDVRTTYGGEISDAAIVVDPVGSIEIEISKCAFADYPPSALDSIVGGTPPTIISSDSSIDTALIGWTTTFSPNDVFRFQVTSVTNVEKATVSLKTIK